MIPEYEIEQIAIAWMGGLPASDVAKEHVRQLIQATKDLRAESGLLAVVRIDSPATVWYMPEADQFIIHHGIIEGALGASNFIDRRAWKRNGWEFICEL